MIELRAITNRLAKSLAGLTMVSSMISPAVLAEEMAVNLPQTVQAPVSIVQPIELAGAPEEALKVFVGPIDACCDGKTPVAGRYSVENDVLSFTPAFGFSAGEDYVVRIAQPQGTKLIPFSFAPDIATVPAAVTEIYPSGAFLPENTLRFYVHFAVPMRPGVAFDHIRLRDAEGNIDDAAFMRFKQELWNEDRTRLTVLMDPGRIKRKVATNIELGPALLAGREYTLSVDAGWASADGRSVLPAFEKRFTVIEPLRDLPDVALWEVSTPCIGTKDPLKIAFDRPFDRHLLSTTMRVTDRDDAVIEGAVEITNSERQWTFIPDDAWHNNGAQVVVTAELEDVAANNFRDLLDHVEDHGTHDVLALAVPVRLKLCSG